jgi:pyruvate/2-oxoglutarate dehydrogenase complex dihydrolipoamide dehydrogenase (E3) component
VQVLSVWSLRTSITPFGTEVTVVEMADQILPIEDGEISKALEKNLTRSGMKSQNKGKR